MVRCGGASAMAREFWWSGRAAMGSCGWRRRRGMRGGRWRRVTMAGGGSSRKGAIDGGSGFTSGGVGVPPAFGRGQEAGGGKVVLVVCL
jgi:hypothetical protein